MTGDNVVFYRGPRHGQSMRVPSNSVRAICFPVATDRMVVSADGRVIPEFGQLIYRRTAHMLSGDRRIYRYEQ